MFKTALRLRFLSDWHIGSGLGNGAIADAILNRDINGIPWIPGSALKGALREAAWRLALFDQKNLEPLVSLLFGTASQDRVSNASGKITVDAARLPAGLVEWLLGMDAAERGEFVADMTIIRQQTALENGIAKEHSLRAIECGIPGLEFTATCYADIPEAANAWFAAYLAALCANVKSLGGYRSRGLGLCLLFCGEQPPAAVSLPPAIPECLNKERPE